MQESNLEFDINDNSSSNNGANDESNGVSAAAAEADADSAIAADSASAAAVEDGDDAIFAGEGGGGGGEEEVLSLSNHPMAAGAAASASEATSTSTPSRTTSSLLAADLSAYFAILSKTISRQSNITTFVGNGGGDATTAVAATSAGDGNGGGGGDDATNASASSTTTTVIKSSTVAMLLWEGVGPILAAGQQQQHQYQQQYGGGGDWMSMSSASFENKHHGRSGTTTMASLISPQQAALYLYAVAQNIVALESAVLGTFSNTAAGGTMMHHGNSNTMGGNATMNKAIHPNQVAEIVSVSSILNTHTHALMSTPFSSQLHSYPMLFVFTRKNVSLFTLSLHKAVSVVASYCIPHHRSIIVQSGILSALAHLIESTGNVPPPPFLSSSSKFGSSSRICLLHSITPFHPEFLQIALFAGQYRYASSFLAYHPTSHTTLDFPYLPTMDPTCYLRTHYLSGLVHMECNQWNAALDSFHLCLTMPCSTVNKLAIAARKKSLLVQCLLLESDEFDGTTTATTATSNTNSASSKRLVEARGAASSSSSTNVASDGSSIRSTKSKDLEKRVLDLPGAASAAVCKYMSASSNRVVGGGGGGGDVGGGGGGAPERTGAGSSEPSKHQQLQHSSFRSERSSRRRTRGGGSSSNSSVEDRSRNTDREHQEGGGPSSSKNHSHLGSYHDLVSTYISGNIRHYAKLLSEMTDLLHTDGNWELAKQLEIRLLMYRSIRKVASVYSVLGLDAVEVKMMMHHDDYVAQLVLGNHGVEDMLMGMASCDAKDPLIVDPFSARIDQSTGMVAFLDDDDEDDDAVDDWLDADLSARLQSCMVLAERVRDMDIAFTTSPKYLQHSVKESMARSDLSASSAMIRQHQQSPQGRSSDFVHGAMDMGIDWLDS